MMAKFQGREMAEERSYLSIFVFVHLMQKFNKKIILDLHFFRVFSVCKCLRNFILSKQSFKLRLKQCLILRSGLLFVIR